MRRLPPIVTRSGTLFPNTTLCRSAAADAVHRPGPPAAPAAGPGHGGRPAAQPGAHAVHHAGHLPDVRPPGAARPRASRRGAAMILSAPFIVRPVAPMLMFLRLVPAGVLPFRLLPVSSVTQRGLPTPPLT